MLGAAAEKIIYLFAKEIVESDMSPGLKREISDASKYRRLKFFLDKTSEALDSLLENEIIPYNIHEGSSHYLASLFDAIRIQRNDAVHPIAGIVLKEQLRLLFLAFPHACKKVNYILDWLKENKNEE